MLKEIGVSEVVNQVETSVSDRANFSPKQLNRRELAKLALAGAVGVTQFDWSQPAVAEPAEPPSSGPQATQILPRGLKLQCLCPANATDEDLKFYKQVGVDGLFINGSASPEIYTVDGLKAVKKRFADAGLNANEIGPTPLSHLTGDIVLNRPGRDKAIDAYIAYIRMIAAAGFFYIPQTFNQTIAVTSGQGEVRGSSARDLDMNGSALFEQDLIIGGNKFEYGDKAARTPGNAKGSSNSLLFGREYTKDEIFANFTYFIKRVVPVLEETRVKIGYHPDDPPVPKLFGVSHIFANFEDYKKALAVANSPNVGILLCCGTWEEGGAAMNISIPDAIRYFTSKKQLFEIHFRNVTSTLPHFTETYPDAGYYDTYKYMKALTDVKFDGYVYLDHAVPMVGGLRTYEAFAVGYMRAQAQRAQLEDAHM